MTGKWWQLAACKGADLELFFPVGTGPGFYDAGKEYCAKCPVVSDCLEDALARGSWHGLYGGLTPNERAVIAAQRGLITRAYTGCGDKEGTTSGYYREKALGLPHCGPCLAAYNAASSARSRRLRERKASER